MARVIVGNQSLPAQVVFIGENLQVWLINHQYTLLIGDSSISVTDPEASELALDLQQLSAPELEQKWLAIGQEFLSSL